MPGAVWLEWDDAAGASGYEVMWRSPGGWALLSEREPAGGVAAEFDGPSAVVAGLPQDLGSYWFAVRARNPWGLSEWSASFEVAVPDFAAEPEAVEPVFDPFTAPTRSDIDLERLGQAAATITPGRADCAAAPALDAAGITIVAPPADLGDPDAELTVAEVVRIAGGCLLVEYADLAGRTIGQVRDLLASDPTVFAVSEPAHGYTPDHDKDGNDDDTAHYDDTTDNHKPDPSNGACCGQWHLTPDITGEFELDNQGDLFVAKDGLWQGWLPGNPVTVAVLDTGVDVTHPDLRNQLASYWAGGCHGEDPHGHGTHVAGIVAAQADNGAHVAGVAPDARILPVSVKLKGNTCKASPGPLSPPAAVAEAVNRGARVINMSFAGTARHNTEGLDAGGIDIDLEDEEADAYETVLRTASMLGAVAVASAGNCGGSNWKANDCPVRNAEQLPAAFSKVLVDAVGAEPVYRDGPVIAVANVAHSGSRSASSTANKLVDIAAPGGNILSTVLLAACEAEDTNGDGADDQWKPLECGLNNPPAECASGTALRRQTDHMPQDCGHRVGFKGGTSMAAPFVSGVVAHMLNRHPEATPGQVRAALERSADDEGSPGRDDEFGHGIVNPLGAVDELGKILGAQRVPGQLGGFTSVAAGGAFSCGLFANGAVRCWGDGDLVAAVPVGQAFSQISAPVGPLGFGCGLRPLGPGDERGTVLCWSGVDSRVSRFAPQGAFTEVAAGQSHTCGLRPGGEAVCWHNRTGVRMAGVPEGRFTGISGGWDHWCGLRANATAVCWDENTPENTPVKAKAPGGDFSDVSAGGSHTCAVTADDGNVACWGAAAVVAGAPSADGEPGFYEVSAGYSHACALEQVNSSGISTLAFGGEVRCWGDNAHGQTDAPPGRFVQVSAGWRHTCGLRNTGRVVCWGDHSAGQGSTADLEEISLADPAGTDLLSALFDAGTLAYVVEAPRGTATLGWTAAATDVVAVSLPDSDPVASGHQVRLPSDRVIKVTVKSLWGYGEESVYSIQTVESPRLESLRLYGPDCLVTDPCTELELDPEFDPETGDYKTTAPAHWNQITVSPTATGGAASTSPPDADPDTLGHQIALSSDGGFVSVDAGGLNSCGIKTGGEVACWGRYSSVRNRTPSGSFAQVSAGWGHACAVRSDGAAVCWGSNPHGQADAPAGKFTAVSAGTSHSCGVKADQSAVCWGENDRGKADAPAGRFTAVSAGRNHTCAVKTDQTAVCWGDNSRGQADAPSGSFTAVSAGTSHSCGIKADQSAVCWGLRDSRSSAPSGQFAAVSAGTWHSCGVKADQSAVCWGGNYAGEAVSPTGPFTSVSAGSGFSCGVRSGGAAVCWGADAWGQQDAPSGLFASIAAGNNHSCGIRAGGSAACWGGNDDGQSNAPAGQFTAVSASGHHSCAIKTDQSAVCWGSNSNGQSNAPAGRFTAVSAGWLHSCAIKTDHTAVCWGRNHNGETAAPTGQFTAVSAGSSHSCAIKADRSAACWGSNSNGQSNAPAGQFTAVSAGSSHSCAIKAGDSGVVCWGDNNSRQSDAPAGEFTAVSAGDYHSCAIEAGDSGVVCWGSNRYGQSDAPAGRFTAVSANEHHTCAITTGQAAVCWGARSPELEPAGPHTVWVWVRREIPAGISGSRIGAAAARYVVTVARPQPPRPQTSGTGAGPGGVGGQAGGSEADSEQQQRFEEERRRLLEEERLLLEEQEEPRPRGHIPPARAYPLPDTAVGPPPAGAQQGGAPGAVAGPGGGGFACPEATGGSGAVAVGDAALRAGIERALGKAAGDAVTAAELGALGELVVPVGGGRVSDLSGLEHASGLRVLDLYGHDVADLGPLSCLRGLVSLELGGNRVSDVSPLRGLAGLTSLGLGGNNIADVSALSGLVGLRSLRLHANEVSDVSALSGLVGLAGLDVSFNEVSDVSPLRGLAGLTSLGLGGNGVSDVSALGGLTALGALYLFDNDIADTSPLSGLSGLRVLWADGNQISAANTLGGLSGLGYLDVRYNLIADLSPLDALGGTVHARPQSLVPSLIADASLLAAVQNALGLRPDQQPTAEQLAGLRTLKRAARRNDPNPIRSLDGLQHATALRTLELPGNHITDLAPISALAELRELDLQSNRIQSLAPLAGLRRLEHLNLILNDLADIADLPQLPQLKTLFIDINRIQSLEPLRNRTQLQRLSASSNQISNLEPIAGLTNLKRLTLSHNHIANIQHLSGLTQISILRLTQNQIADISPLAPLTQITDLRLAHNNITDISPLAQLPRLWFLDITHNNIADTTPLNNHPTLKFLYT
ncbi:leucine-rich repeat domain-containing protein [Candidatus Poriferisocius sp.]|uniref:leucine-rich repeat domain-containing protein n=1 Tax=Candidatus Poriferisocius sp. TaxID=3101276 RepID=UPI003B0134C5